MMESTKVLLEKNGPIARVTFNRPEVLNAFGRHWPYDLLEAARAMQADADVRVVLVTGEGRTFSSGLDLTQLAAGEITTQFFHDAEFAFRSMETIDKVTICGIQGYCLGGGLQLAIACDVRIATDDAVLGLPAVQEAFLPGMGTYRLPRLIGMGWARHLILSGENVDAAEAYRIGLVNKVVPRADLDAELEAWAARYLDVPRPSLTYAKRLSNQAYDLPFEQFVPVYDEAMKTVLASEEHLAARRAWVERLAQRRKE